MIQGGATTQLTPVGVGWGDYVIAWLLTYSGSDCRLWSYVYSKCVESELCRRVIEMLPSIGLSIMRHKCYADLDDLNDAEPRFLETPQPPNSTSTKPTTTTKASHPNTYSNAQKQSPSKPKRLSRLGPRNQSPSPGSSLPSSTLPT